MAIPLFSPATGALFRRLGKYIGPINKAYTQHKATTGAYGTEYTATLDAADQTSNLTDGSGVFREEDIASPLRAAYDAYRWDAGLRAYLQAHQAAAEKILIRMAWRDAGKPFTLEEAYRELVRQMRASSNTVDAMTVSGSLAAGSGNVGTGTVVLSATGGDGRDREMLFAEAATIRVIRDSYSGGAVRNQETLAFIGLPRSPLLLPWNSPLHGLHPDYGEAGYGSGGYSTATVVDSSRYAPGGNLLVNGFENFTANIPDNWTRDAGTAGVDFQSSAAQQYFGSNSLQLIGGGGGNTALAQTFTWQNVPGQTPSILTAMKRLAYLIFIKADVVPASGVLTFELTDSSGTVLTNAAGGNCNSTLALSTTTTSWAAYTGSFSAPKTIPSGAKFRVRASTVVPGGSNLFLDGLALAEMVECYPGGGFWRPFSGNVPFIGHTDLNPSDYWTATFTNDHGAGGGPAVVRRHCWQGAVDALLNIGARGLPPLPSNASGSETVATSLLAT